MTVREVVQFIGWARGLSSGRARERADQVIEQVGLTARAHEQTKRLSGGMTRRVALAQALVSEPEVLLLDEPSTGLDPEQRRAMVDLVKGLHTTVLFSSHIVEDVKDVAQRVLVLEDGRLLFDGSVAELEAMAPPPTDEARVGSRVEAGFMKLVAADRGRRG
jgi:ABC-2 type transport system ATP-binding protein